MGVIADRIRATQRRPSGGSSVRRSPYDPKASRIAQGVARELVSLGGNPREVGRTLTKGAKPSFASQTLGFLADTLRAPGRLVVTAGSELGELMGVAKDDKRSFLDKLSDKDYGFGTYAEDQGIFNVDEKSSNAYRLAAGLTGFAGDVLFDPLTYMSFGASPAIKAAGRSKGLATELIEVASRVAPGTKAEADLMELAHQVQKGVHNLSNTQLDTVALATGRAPGTLRFGTRAFGKELGVEGAPEMLGRSIYQAGSGTARTLGKARIPGGSTLGEAFGGGSQLAKQAAAGITEKLTAHLDPVTATRYGTTVLNAVGRAKGKEAASERGLGRAIVNLEKRAIKVFGKGSGPEVQRLMDARPVRPIIEKAVRAADPEASDDVINAALEKAWREYMPDETRRAALREYDEFLEKTRVGANLRAKEAGVGDDWLMDSAQRGRPFVPRNPHDKFVESFGGNVRHVRFGEPISIEKAGLAPYASAGTEGARNLDAFYEKYGEFLPEGKLHVPGSKVSVVDEATGETVVRTMPGEMEQIDDAVRAFHGDDYVPWYEPDFFKNMRAYRHNVSRGIYHKTIENHLTWKGLNESTLRPDVQTEAWPISGAVEAGTPAPTSGGTWFQTVADQLTQSGYEVPRETSLWMNHLWQPETLIQHPEEGSRPLGELVRMLEPHLSFAGKPVDETSFDALQRLLSGPERALAAAEARGLTGRKVDMLRAQANAMRGIRDQFTAHGDDLAEAVSRREHLADMLAEAESRVKKRMPAAKPEVEAPRAPRRTRAEVERGRLEAENRSLRDYLNSRKPGDESPFVQQATQRFVKNTQRLAELGPAPEPLAAKGGRTFARGTAKLDPTPAIRKKMDVLRDQVAKLDHEIEQMRNTVGGADPEAIIQREKLVRALGEEMETLQGFHDAVESKIARQPGRKALGEGAGRTAVRGEQASRTRMRNLAAEMEELDREIEALKVRQGAKTETDARVAHIEVSARQMRGALAALGLQDTSEAVFANTPANAIKMKKVLHQGWEGFGFNRQAPSAVVEMLKDINRAYDPSDSKTLRKFFGEVWDPLNNWMKGWMTATPGFQWRNGFGGAFNNWLAGVDPKHSIRWGKLMHKAAYNHDTLTAGELAVLEINDAVGVLGTGQVVSEVVGASGMSANPLAGIRNADKAFVLPYFSRKLSGQVMEPWLRGSLAYDRLTKALGEGRFASLGVRSIDDITAENMDAFVQAVKDSPLLDSMIDDVYKYHFDYDDLSRFERQWGRRIIPFYTWTRKSVPLQLELLATQPGRSINRFHDLKRNLEGVSDEEGIAAPWLSESGLIRMPFQTGGDQVYGTIDLPFRDPFETLDVTGQFAGMLNPLIKAPIESYVAGKNLWSDVPLRDTPVPVPGTWSRIPFLMEALKVAGGTSLIPFDPPQKMADGRWAMREIDLHMIGQYLPFLQQARRLMPWDEEKVKGEQSKYDRRVVTTWISYLTGTNFRTNTPQDMESEMYRRADILGDERAELKALGFTKANPRERAASPTEMAPLTQSLMDITRPTREPRERRAQEQEIPEYVG